MVEASDVVDEVTPGLVLQLVLEVEGLARHSSPNGVRVGQPDYPCRSVGATSVVESVELFVDDHVVPALGTTARRRLLPWLLRR